MIGQLRFPDGRIAFMDDDGKWHSLDPILETQLELSYDPARIGPACMPWGECALALAADQMGAIAEFRDPIATVPKGCV